MRRFLIFFSLLFFILLSSPRAEAADFSSVKTVFLIMFENHDWSSIKSAPYFSSILKQGAHAEQYYNPPGIHPSEPNYIWLEAGNNFGITDDNNPDVNHISSSAHLVTQLKNAGISWKAYQEGIGGNECPITETDKFAPKHLGPLFFEDVVGNPPSASNNYCIAHVRPYDEIHKDLQNNTVARYNLVTPDLCHSMHDCSVATGDRWLSQELPKIMASNAYKDNGAVFIGFDEGENNSDRPIGMILMSPFAKKGYSNNIRYTHSSMLRTFQEIFSLQPFLGDAAMSNDLAGLFDFSFFNRIRVWMGNLLRLRF